MVKPFQGRSPTARRRDGQRGSAMVLTTIAMTSLAALGGLTILSVRGGIAATGQERFKSVATYAAESGAAAAINALRYNFDWDPYFGTNPTGVIFGNNAPPGDAANLFSSGLGAWYSVEVRNNTDDLGGPTDDTDKRAIVRSTGYGPDGAMAIIEWEVLSGGTDIIAGRPCPGYGQKGISEDGAGRNDCLVNINATAANLYTPGS